MAAAAAAAKPTTITMVKGHWLSLSAPLLSLLLRSQKTTVVVVQEEPSRTHIFHCGRPTTGDWPYAASRVGRTRKAGNDSYDSP